MPPMTTLQHTFSVSGEHNRQIKPEPKHVMQGNAREGRCTLRVAVGIGCIAMRHLWTLRPTTRCRGRLNYEGIMVQTLPARLGGRFDSK